MRSYHYPCRKSVAYGRVRSTYVPFKLIAEVIFIRPTSSLRLTLQCGAAFKSASNFTVRSSLRTFLIRALIFLIRSFIPTSFHGENRNKRWAVPLGYFGVPIWNVLDQRCRMVCAKKKARLRPPPAIVNVHSTNVLWRRSSARKQTTPHFQPSCW